MFIFLLFPIEDELKMKIVYTNLLLGIFNLIPIMPLDGGKILKEILVKKNGKNAITHFKVLERFPKHNCTLLEIKIETGRTHQIRVHLSHIGYPVIGDEVYSSGKNEWNVKGQCLHAKSLKFKHPITNKEMFLEAKIPDYLKNIIEDMEQEGQAPFVSKI